MSARHAKRAREPASGIKSAPSKRVKRIGRRPQYHSSSEDEGETGATDANAIAISTTPQSRRKKEEQVDANPKDVEQTVKTEAVPPRKGILKVRPPPLQADQEAQEAEQSDGDDSREDDDIDFDEGGVGLDEASASDLDESSDEDEDEDDEMLSQSGSTAGESSRTKKRRSDPDAFATSMSKILSSGLSGSKKADPVLSRSKDAQSASKEVLESRLETRARHKLREEKRIAKSKGRISDVLGLQTPDTSTADIQEQEKRYRKIAQRGVIKLFNAVRAAQVKAEEAQGRNKKDGLVGVDRREERVTEMSKQGFLDLIASGGK